MGEELLWVEIQDNIGWIKINREKKLNALNQNLIDALHHTFIDFQNNQEVRVIILTGSGDKAFVAPTASNSTQETVRCSYWAV